MNAASIMARIGAAEAGDFDPFLDLTPGELSNLSRADRAALVLEAQQLRIEAVKEGGGVPEGCGDDVIVQPARGAVRVSQTTALYPDGADGYVSKPAGYMGRKTMRRADAFDVACGQAARNKRAAPYTPSQIAMGRTYRDLVERLAAAGVRCSSIEGLPGGSGGSGGGWIDAVIRDSRRLYLLRGRIGTGVSLKVRRIRPSARGSRVNIPDRVLVDAVCVGERALVAILDQYGWTNEARHRRALQEALACALDRMMGPVRGARIGSVHFGDGPGSIWGDG